jgi:hypothetical protein
MAKVVTPLVMSMINVISVPLKIEKSGEEFPPPR